MKVLRRGVRDEGAIYLDPVRLPAILANAARGFANGVLTDENLIASTIECSSHHESTDAAGIHLQDIDWKHPVPGQGHLRLQMDGGGVEAEFWYEDEDPDLADGTCPLSAEQLAAVVDWMGNHPKIKLAYLGAAAPQLQVSLLYMGARAWIFRDGEIHETEDTPIPARACP